MPVSPKKLDELRARMEQWGLLEQDLEESFTRGGGKGGQKVNKTNNCVCLRHAASGLVVRAHRERERETNRYLARRALVDELEFLATGVRPKRVSSGSAKNKKSPMRHITVTRRISRPDEAT